MSIYATQRLGSTETSQRWRAVGDTVSNLAGPGIDPKATCAISDVFNHYTNHLVSISLSKNVLNNEEVAAVFISDYKKGFINFMPNVNKIKRRFMFLVFVV